jgi:hypothetical protein
LEISIEDKIMKITDFFTNEELNLFRKMIFRKEAFFSEKLKPIDFRDAVWGCPEKYCGGFDKKALLKKIETTPKKVIKAVLKRYSTPKNEFFPSDRTLFISYRKEDGSANILF